MFGQKKLMAALRECLALLEASADVEVCLRAPSPEGKERGRQKLRAFIAQGQPGRSLGGSRPLLLLGRPAIALLAATVLTSVGLAAAASDGFRDAFPFTATSKGGPDLEGSLASVGDGSFTIATGEGQVAVSFSDALVVESDDGQVISLGDLPPGTNVKVETEEADDGSLTAVSVEVEDEEADDADDVDEEEVDDADDADEADGVGEPDETDEVDEADSSGPSSSGSSDSSGSGSGSSGSDSDSSGSGSSDSGSGSSGD